MKNLKSLVGFILTAALLISQGTASAESTIRMTDLGTLGGNSAGLDVNDAGQVAGSSYDATGKKAFIWENGTMTSLGTLGGSVSGVGQMTSGVHFGKAINNAGQIVGHSTNSAGQTHAFIWENGVMTDLGTLGGNYDLALDINEHGQVAGTSYAGGAMHAFIWENGVITDLGIEGGASEAVAINDAGQIAANSADSAYLWENGVLTNLGTLGDSASAVDIDENGRIVGNSTTTMGNYSTSPVIISRGFIWEDGTMTDLGDLGGGLTSVSDINNLGQVVGYSYTSSGNPHAFVWANGVMTDLGTLGGSTSIAYAINNSGQIVGYSMDATGKSYAFVWDNSVMRNLGTLGNASYAYDINENGQITGDSYINFSQKHAVLWEILSFQPVSIDVIPYDPANEIDMVRAKTVPVAILGSANFDAGTVDPTTVFLNSAPIKQRKNGAYMYTFEDVNTDGLADMVCQIDASQLSLPMGVSTVTLQGSTTSLQAIQGEDLINRTR